jgi:geranylgeranyl diphosphate synthase type I
MTRSDRYPKEGPALSSLIDHDAEAMRTVSPPDSPVLLSDASAALLDHEITVALEAFEGSAPLLGQMIQFHLGMIDSTGEPTTPEERLALQGKRLRPAIALLSAQAIGGNAEIAAPLAAAIELLHNFSLIHDDIQDRSPNRRHRATVWRIWGDAQAINAGDALFAVAHLTLLRTPLPDDRLRALLDLTRAFNTATLDIVRGQVLDVEFEGRSDVTPEQYLEMIRGKTAAIVRFAASGGAIVAGAGEASASLFAEFGEALGIGFQIRDDLLGIWGDNSDTGKTRGDDIRRRKQSLPLLLLRAAASPGDLARLDVLSREEEVPEAGIAEVFEMLDRYTIRRLVEGHIAAAHERAARAFDAVSTFASTAARTELMTLMHRLEHRNS